MNEDELISNLNAATPAWMADGKGLQGDRSPIYREEANLNFRHGSFEVEQGYDDPAPMDTTDGAMAPLERARMPLEIIDASDDNGAKIRVIPSAVSGYPIPEYNASVSASGYVWIGVLRSGAGISSAYITHGTTLPEDDDPTYIIAIGQYTVASGAVTPTNYRYGAVYVTFCRDWFTNPPEYRPSIT